MNQSVRAEIRAPIKRIAFLCLIFLSVTLYAFICRAEIVPNKDNIVKDVSELTELYTTIIPVGVKAPAFKIEDLNGNTFDTKDYFGKDITLLYFWSVSCPYCRKAMPHINELDNKYKPRGLKILAVNLDGVEFESAINSYIKENKITLNIPVDKMNEKNLFFHAADPFGVNKTPTVFLVNEKGIIEHTIEYEVDYDDLEKEINAALEKKLKSKVKYIVIIAIAVILVISILIYIFYIRPKSIHEDIIDDLKRRTQNAYDNKNSGS